MSLFDYNRAQLAEIRKYVNENGGDLDNDSKSVRTVQLIIEWKEKGMSEQFRKKWEEKHGVMDATE